MSGKQAYEPPALLLRCPVFRSLMRRLNTHDFVGSWVVMALFGAIYAVIGGVTTVMFEKRRRA